MYNKFSVDIRPPFEVAGRRIKNKSEGGRSMINSVKKAMDILKLISDNPQKGISLKKITEETGINKSTCVHILNTLLYDGYIVKISRSKGYRLGPAAFCLTRFGNFDEELIGICRPVLKWLGKKTNRTVLLAVLESKQKYIIDYIDCNEKFFSKNIKIFEDNIYRTASGRILLSHLPEEDLYEIYKRHGNPSSEDWEGINSFEEFCAALKKIRNSRVVKAYSKTGDVFHFGYAKGIFKGGECVGAIGVAEILNNEEEIREYVKNNNNEALLLCAAKEIDRRLDYDEKV